MAIELSKPARTTVEIKNSRGVTVATLLHRRHRSSGQHVLHWDGYDDFGRVAPPGEYTIQATANTTGGSVKGTLNISILEDKTVHRQYLRRLSQQDDEYVRDRRAGEVVRTGSSQRSSHR
jgi:flagellar hook assembly protein FlgD